MSGPFDSGEFIRGYLAEAEEHLRAAGANLLAIDAAQRRGASQPKAARELFRSLHTLKGLSAMVGAEPVVEIAHEMESLLRTAEAAGGRVPDGAVERLLEGLRAMEARVAALGRGEALAPAPAGLLETLRSLRKGAPPPPPRPSLDLDPDVRSKLTPADEEQLSQGVEQGRRALRVDFYPSPALVARGVTITTVRERVAALGDLVKVVPRSVPPGPRAPGGLAFVLLLVTDASDDTLAAAAAAEPHEVRSLVAGGPAVVGRAEAGADEAGRDREERDAEDVPQLRHDFVRVQIGRLDEALERLSELVVSRFRLERAVAEILAGREDTRSLGVIVAEQGRQLRDLRRSLMRARLVPVAEALERVPLVVHGLAQTASKKVRVVLEAGRAELDKSVAERLFPAIVHLLRNAVDHALETPAERREAGKDEEGLLEIRCRERSDHQLEVVVRDDGRGIDAGRLAERAGVAAPATEAELLELLTRPGLSTRDDATLTSGRGMGMDIVKRIVVEELGGVLRARTSVGRGTEFTLRVPLSITIVEALSFVCGGETFAVPVSAVADLVDVDSDDVGLAPGGPGRAPRRLLRHRGGAVPLVPLCALLQLERAPSERSKAIVVQRVDSEAVAFEVERMVGQHEIVVRPVADPLVRVAGVHGTTDLGDGRPTLVLDLAGLVSGGAGGSREAAP